MTLIIVFSALGLKKGFRIYSVLTLIALMLFGALTAMQAPHVEKNLPTPWAGVWERINIGVYLVWISVLAVVLRGDCRD